MKLNVAKTGKVGEKVWVAKISGTDAMYGFSRMFCELFRNDGSRKSWTESTGELRDGLYEIAEAGDRDYRIIWTDGDAQKTRTITSERAKKMAEMMDSGVAFEEARVLTKEANASVQPVAKTGVTARRSCG